MSSNIKDSSHFIEKLNNNIMQQNDMLASFDDVSLLTNVLLEDYIKEFYQKKYLLFSSRL